MYIKDLNFLFETDKFKVFFKKNEIIVTSPFASNYLFNDDIFYQCKETESFNSNDIIKILALKKDLPTSIKESIIDRNKDLKGTTLSFLTGRNDKSTIFSNPISASLYGIKDYCDINLEIINSFDNVKFFEESFVRDSSDYYYGLWGIESNSVCSSFIFNHPLLVRMCFACMGKSEIKKGSKFIKLKISN